MCKIVYLTSRRFDSHSNDFKSYLSDELKKRGITVVNDYAFDLFNFFRSHKTYGIAIAIDFYDDGGEGSGLLLNKNCSVVCRDFAYNLSNNLDIITPMIKWRDIGFVDSHNNIWYKFFNKVSSSTKAVFYLCTKDNESDWNSYSVAFKDLITLFADEIERCLNSDYDAKHYCKTPNEARLNLRKTYK